MYTPLSVSERAFHISNTYEEGNDRSSDYVSETSMSEKNTPILENPKI